MEPTSGLPETKAGAGHPMTAQEALEAFLTPPRSPETSREAELAVQAERSRLRVGGEAIEVYAWGAGKPVLLVHGWGGRGTQLGTFVPPLREVGLRVVAFDGPGHGRSEGTLSSGVAIGRAAQAVAEREGPLAAILAHSVGAYSAAIALSRGVRAQKVVFLGACCWIVPSLTEFARKNGMPEETEQELLRIFLERFAQIELAVDEIAPRMTVPALLLHDPQDSEVPYAHAEAIAAAWPNARLIALPGVGHRRILRAREVVGHMLAFIMG